MASTFADILNSVSSATDRGITPLSAADVRTPAQGRLALAEIKERNNRVILDVVDDSLQRSQQLREEAAKRRAEEQAEQARLDRSREERERTRAEGEAAAQTRQAELEAQQARRDEFDTLQAELASRRAARDLNIAA